MEVYIMISYFSMKKIMTSLLTHRDSYIILKDYLRSKLTIVGVVSPSPVKTNIYVYT